MIMIHEGRKAIDLSGTWKYRYETEKTGGISTEDFYAGERNAEDGWKEIAVPNNWYLTEIGDYFGTIWFQCEFETPEFTKEEHVWLRFGAVDYTADVWLNDIYLGCHEGIFNPFEFDITNFLKKEGSNRLFVRDSAPRDETEYINSGLDKNTPLSEPYQRHQAKAITQVKGHMIDAMHRPGAMTSFRQDGNSAGIWDKVELIIRPEKFIEYCKISTRLVQKKDWLGDGQDKDTGSAMVSLDITLNNMTSATVTGCLRGDIIPDNFEGGVASRSSRNVVIPPGRSTVKMVITVEEAKLWWTWDHGYPHLYNLVLGWQEDTVKIRFGIKEIVQDDAGQWYLNNKRIFLRGMRYISSLWMSEAGEEMWKPDFEKMIRMNINSIRIGSHMEKDGLYSLCDELGLLMWQVFPLHYCVSDDDDMISRASDMIRDMGMMLTNHACMGMWSVYKEPEIYQLPDKPNNYFRLCQVLKETLKTVDPVRWVHLGDYREGVMNIMIGCCSDGDTDVDDLIIPPNIVEFGSQSIPCLETLRTFIPEDKLWPPHWDTWEYWGLFYSNTFEFAKVELGNSLEEFIENTQEYEAVSVKEQIEFLRMKKYDPVSSMYLYYWSDACPMIGSGLLDYYRRPYKVYDYMQKVYTPVLVCAQPCIHPYKLGREKIFHVGMSYTARVWAINDNYESIPDVLLQWKVTDCETDEILCRNSFRLELLADSAEIPDHIVLPLSEELSGHRCRVDMKISSGNEILSENDSYFRVEP